MFTDDFTASIVDHDPSSWPCNFFIHLEESKGYGDASPRTKDRHKGRETPSRSVKVAVVTERAVKKCDFPKNRFRVFINWD